MRHLSFVLLGFALLACFAFAQQISAQDAQPASTHAVGAPSASLPAQSGSAVENEADPLLDLPPLPETTVSLVGGKVTGIDRVRNKLTVQAFHGKKMKFAFDERTHFYRDGAETTQLGIKKGDRVYVDTQLVGSTVFARNIRVNNQTGPADAQGQIEAYDPERGTMMVRDTLSSQAVVFRVTSKTSVRGKATSIAELQRGALVNVKFVPGTGDHGLAREITVTARPGEMTTFAGRVTYLDLRSGILAVQNLSDNKKYEIKFDPSNVTIGNLGVGSEVTISAVFDGSGYTARDLRVKEVKQAKQ